VDKIMAELLNLLDNFSRLDLQPQSAANANQATVSALGPLGYSDFLSIVEELAQGWPANQVVAFLEVCEGCDAIELLILLDLLFILVLFVLA
jgi:hypothetical protein